MNTLRLRVKRTPSEIEDNDVSIQHRDYHRIFEGHNQGQALDAKNGTHKYLAFNQQAFGKRLEVHGY